MKRIGITSEEIREIASKYNITDENVISFITEVVNTNNDILEDYLSKEYLDNVNRDMQLRIRSRR